MNINPDVDKTEKEIGHHHSRINEEGFYSSSSEEDDMLLPETLDDEEDMIIQEHGAQGPLLDGFVDESS